MINQLRLVPLLFILLLTASSAALAETVVTDIEEDEEDDRILDWLIEKRNSWSNDVGSLGRYIDGFLGDETATRRNRSFVRVSAFGNWNEGADFAFDPRIKFRLDLPTTKERFKLVIESDDDNDKIDGQRVRREDPASVDQTTDGGVSGFVRRVREVSGFETRFDAGLRFRFPPQPFVRARADRDWQLDWSWSTRSETEISYTIGGDELVFRQNGNLDWQITNVALMRARTEITWKQAPDNAPQDAWEFAEVLSYNRRMNDYAALVHAVGYVWESRPKFRTREYFTYLRWRQRLYEQWLFVEFTPGISWTRENNFNDSAYFEAGIEIIFSE